MKTLFSWLAFIFTIFCYVPPRASAESVILSTGEILEGTLVNPPANITIETEAGKRTLPFSEIKSFSRTGAPTVFTPFLETEDAKKALPDQPETGFPESESTGPFSSPRQTFETWKAAALKGDIDGMSQCYVAYRRDKVKKDLKKLPKKTREEMKAAMTQTIFGVADPFFQGESAIMEVTWTKELASQTQTLKFALEKGNEWKIVE